MRDQPWFLNQVVEIQTSLFPKQLLARLQKIEIGMGRVRVEARGPRTVAKTWSPEYDCTYIRKK